MTTLRQTDPVRWIAVVVIPPLAALSMQALVLPLAWSVLGGLSGDPRSIGWIVWAGKCATSPFMGSAFVVAVWLTAPTKKAAASTIALAAVTLWGGFLMVGAFYARADGTTHWWLFRMGLAGIMGGVIPWWFLRRRYE